MKKKKPANNRSRPEGKDTSAGSSRGRIGVFVVAAAAISGYLLLQAMRDGDRGSESPTSAPASNPRAETGTVSEGVVLPEVSLVSLAGEPLQLKVAGSTGPVLLYVFSPQCSICTETIPAWKELFEVAESESVEVVGMSVLDPARTAPYVQEHGLPWNVYCAAGTDAVEALGIERVPMTFVIDRGGAAHTILRGRLDPDQTDTIARFLKGEDDRSANRRQ